MIWGIHQRRHPLRLAVLIVAVIATLAVASVSALPSHIHAKAPSNACELCVAAHSMAYEVRLSVPAAGVPLIRERILAPHQSSCYQSYLPSAGLTRGPPSFV